MTISDVRPFKGKASTTQLIKGVRQAYLEIRKDYAVNPMDTAFMFLGTRHHAKLEAVAKKLEMIAEEKLKGEVSGILDLLEPDTLTKDSFILYDYKTSGSYAVARALGRKSLSGESDAREWELQLNKYRLECENIGFKISRMIIQACVRDGGTYTARNNNVPEKFVLIPIKRLDDLEVFHYFNDKDTLLKQHLAENTLPPVCNSEENWNWRKCKVNRESGTAYCSVYEFCPEGAKINKMEVKDE